MEHYPLRPHSFAQTTLRSICGQHELDYLLTERKAINEAIQDVLDRETDPWGVKVNNVEVKQIDLLRRCSERWRNKPRLSASDVPR